MKMNEKGLSAVELFAVVVIVGLLVFVGWRVWDANSVEEAQETQTPTTTQETTTDVANETKSIDGINYTIPTDWQNTANYYEPYEAGKGNYLLSPDYKELNEGQVVIQTGAYIHFDTAQWEGIKPSTTTEQALSIVKSSDGAYMDTSSAKIQTVGDAEVIILDSGHLDDGVTVLYKTSEQKWLSADYYTSSDETENEDQYNAQDSTHYQTFLAWLETFVTLNK